jgi:hypothetical protein
MREKSEMEDGLVMAAEHQRPMQVMGDVCVSCRTGLSMSGIERRIEWRV